MKRFGKPEMQELLTRLDYVLLGYPKVSVRKADTRPIIKHGVELGKEFITGTYKSVDADGNVYLVTFKEPVNMPEFSNSVHIEGRLPTVRQSKRLVANWEKFRAVSDERMADAATVDYVQRKKGMEADV